jgi:hypothetical protein
MTLIRNPVAVIDNKVIDGDTITSVGTADARTINLETADKAFLLTPC